MKIEKEIIQILADTTTDGNLLFLPCQMERNTYTKVAKVLKAIGGKWNSSKKAFVFKSPVDDTLEDIINTRQYTSEKTVYQFFPTPEPLARQIVERACIKPGETTLEPSAGVGNIAKFLPSPDVIELNPDNRKRLVGQGFNLIHDDFLTFTPQKQYDVIVMNPPFCKGQDIAHVTKAISVARRCVVAIVSQSVMFHSGKAYKEFRELVESYGGTIEALPEKSFKSEGTAVNTALVVVNKLNH